MRRRMFGIFSFIESQARRRRPGGYRLRREPHGQAAASAQTGIVLGPAGHPVALLGDVMTPSGIRFERQEACPCIVEGLAPAPSYPTPPKRAIGATRRQAVRTSR